jgi:hypothetical protein
MSWNWGMRYTMAVYESDRDNEYPFQYLVSAISWPIHPDPGLLERE